MTEEIDRRIAELCHPEPRVRCSALMELAEQDDVPLPPLHTALRDTDLAVRGCAAFALSKIGDESSLPELVDAWRSSRPEETHLRRQILIALSDVGDTKWLAQVVERFGDWPAELQELVFDQVASDSGPDAERLLAILDAQALSPPVRSAVTAARAHRAVRRS
ncbi:MAG TPA: HEAT repeat domain-containing protein [Kofleriaceae bacterium]|jgi:HEAT repeat protein|nr:HEAT repeat domain-containing protein [Kofleriaceae bacterium]